MNTIINKNLKEALTQVRGRYYDGCDVYMEIPEFLIPPKNYREFGLDIHRSPSEFDLEYIRTAKHNELKRNFIRIYLGEESKLFDLTDDKVVGQIIDYLHP